jgi:bifunctional DNA-binding transcriptional regulator/antitoxin component of YhaV-PrlF toxin-antitoxin module
MRRSTEDDARVRLSSKGQLVVPARIRRRLGWVTGRTIQLHVETNRQLRLSLLDETEGVEDMLARTRAWARKSGRDLVDELHERRRSERHREELRARRGR